MLPASTARRAPQLHSRREARSARRTSSGILPRCLRRAPAGARRLVINFHRRRFVVPTADSSAPCSPQRPGPRPPADPAPPTDSRVLPPRAPGQGLVPPRRFHPRCGGNSPAGAFSWRSLTPGSGPAPPPPVDAPCVFSPPPLPSRPQTSERSSRILCSAPSRSGRSSVRTLS